MAADGGSAGLRTRFGRSSQARWVPCAAMRRRVGRARAWIFVAVIVLVAAMACTQTTGGTAERARPTVPDPERSYGYVDDRCGLLLDTTIQEMLGADDIVRPYSGAVCQYVLSTSAGLVDVVYSWFDAGSFERERAVAVDRGSEVTDTDVARHPAFVAQQPDQATACSATAAAGTGVLTWWVQFRPGTGDHGAEPCATAEELLAATLSADM